MTTSIVLLVLLAAVMHASWNALAKSGGEPLFSIATYQMAGSAVAICLLPFFPLPAAESWWAIGASVLIHTVYYFTTAGALKNGDLGQIYPLYRGLSPVLVAVCATIFAKEYLSASQMFAIALISLALISLAWHRDAIGRVSRTGLLWALATSVTIAAYTVVDGIGVRLAGNPFSYIVWLFALEAIVIGPYVLIMRRRAFSSFVRANWTKALAGGVVSNGAYALVIFAMSLGPIALVSSLRETSVVFAAIIGTVFLGERFGRRRILASAMVVVGVVAVRLLS